MIVIVLLRKSDTFNLHDLLYNLNNKQVIIIKIVILC